MKFANKHTIQR